MSDLRLGKLISETDGRDAAHVAVAPVIAGERLVPGSHVGFLSEFDFERVGVRCRETIGVVDPFLTEIVEIGQRCYMLMYPQTVTVLRHAWEHPAFEKSASVQYLTDCAKQVGMDYLELIGRAEQIAEGGYDYIYAHSAEDAPLLLDTTAFWKHYENATGKKPGNQHTRVVDFCC